MKKFLIFAIIIVSAYFGYKHYHRTPENTQKVQETLTTEDGKYSYEKFNDNFLNYIKKYDNGRIYAQKNEHPKVVLYTNVIDTRCPYRRNFQKKILQYVESEAWQKKYYFVKNDVPETEEKFFRTMEEYNEYSAYTSTCGFFCIINFDKNAVFKGQKNSDEYVYSVLYSFYND